MIMQLYHTYFMNKPFDFDITSNKQRQQTEHVLVQNGKSKINV